MATILCALNMPHYAGTERVFVQHAKMLAAHGHTLFCLMPEKAQAKAELETIPSITIIEDEAIHLHKGRFNPFLFFRYRKLLKEKGIELVMAHSGGLVKLFKPICKGICPVVAVNHNTSAKGSSRADYAITVGRPIHNELIKEHGFPAEKSLLLFNSIEVPEGEAAFHPFHNPVAIGYLGRMDDNKSIETLLHAAQKLQERGLHFSLILGGDGPLRPALESLAATLGISENTRFTGWVEDKTTFFSGIDILCCCSLSEGFPLVILEAMQHGIPVISSDFAGIEDMIQDGKTGVVFEKKNAGALADQLHWIIQNPFAAEAFAKAALMRLQAEFSTAQASRKMHDFLAGILQRDAA